MQVLYIVHYSHSTYILTYVQYILLSIYMYIIGEGLGTCHCFSIYLLSFKIKLPKAASKHNCNVSCALSTLFGNTGVMSCKYVFFPKSVSISQKCYASHFSKRYCRSKSGSFIFCGVICRLSRDINDLFTSDMIKKSRAICYT